MRRSLDLPPCPSDYVRHDGLLVPAKREFPIQQMLTISPAGPGVTYATWNPADKAANITLSGGNLIASQSTAAWDSVRSTISKSSGKWYWEITIGTLDDDHSMVGIAKSDMTLAGNYPGGASGTGYGYYHTGAKFSAGSGSAYGASYTTGDVIGVALDMDGGSIVFYKNNVSQGTAFSGLSGAYFACQGLQIGTGTVSVTANFGTALTYSPPGGFNAGLYS